MGVMKLYYAVSGHGQANVYTGQPPVRHSHFKVWVGHIDGCICSTVSMMESEGLVSFPPMTWEDEPFEFELLVKTSRDEG